MPNEQNGLQSLWEAVNRPLVMLPRAETDPQLQADLAQQMVAEPGNNTSPEGTWRSLQLMNQALREGWNRVGAGTLETLSSPLSLLSMGAGGAASAAGRRGLLGISRMARGGEAALNAPAVAHGAYNVATADSPGQAAAGALEAGLGGYGALSSMSHSFPVDRVARTYVRERGLPQASVPLTKEVDQTLAARVADAYQDMQHLPNDPQVHRAYAALADEVGDQFEFMVKRAGVKVEPWKGKGEPYKNSAAMVSDLRKRNHLWYLPTSTEFGAGASVEEIGNPLLAKGRHGLPVNDEFRAIHDYFGHARYGNGFGPVGEENATRTHSTMFSDTARPAMVTETRGQNSWVNFGPHLRRPDGSVPQRGDKDFVPLQNRPFAAQKTGLLPEGMSRSVATLADFLGP